MNQVQPCLPCLGYPNSSGDLFFSISPVAAIPVSYVYYISLSYLYLVLMTSNSCQQSLLAC